MNKRNTYSGVFKARVAIESLRGDKTLAELSSKYQVHSNQITNWKSRLVNNAKDIFQDKRQKRRNDKEIHTDELYRQIGQLKVELDWLKKKSGINS